jgi:hypothetical protein
MDRDVTFGDGGAGVAQDAQIASKTLQALIARQRDTIRRRTRRTRSVKSAVAERTVRGTVWS